MSEEWAAVVAAARAHGVEVVADAEAGQLADAVAARHVANPRSRWWWADLAVEAETLSYEGADGLAVLERLLPPGADDLVLLVTNEQPVPEGAVRGRAEDLLAVVRDCPGFEFAVVPPTLDWIVFDTHMNTLVASGLALAP